MDERIEHGKHDESLRNYSIENPQYPLSDPRFMEGMGIGGVGTTAGVNVGHGNALSYSPVWAAVDQISSAVAGMPLGLFDETAAETRPVVNSFVRVLADKPNDQECAYRFWKRLTVQLLIWGAAYVLLRLNRDGTVDQALPLLSDRTRPLRRPDSTLWFETEIDGRLWEFPADTILYFEWISLNQLNPADPVKHARDAWALGLAAQGFESRFYRRGGRLGGVLQLPSGMPPMARDRAEQGFRSTYEDPDKAFSVAVLRDNVKFHTAQATIQQAMTAESRKESVRDVSRIYGVPMSRLGESDGSYQPKGEANRVFLDMAVRPHLQAIVGELNCKTLQQEERLGVNRPRRSWRHDTSQLLQLNEFERWQIYEIALRSTGLNRNEVRRKEGLPAVPGGNEFANPNTSSGRNSQNKSIREAAISAAVDRAIVAMRPIFGRLNARASDPQAFEREVDGWKSNRQEIMEEAMAPHSQLLASLGSHDVDLAATVYSHLESRLDWILNNVAVSKLPVELEALASGMPAKLKELFAEDENGIPTDTTPRA